MTFRIGFPTLPPLTDPNFSGALQRDIDDLSRGLGAATSAVGPAVSGVEIGLVLIRGAFTAANPAVLTLGSGYAVARTAVGQWDITFTTAFSANPIVTGNLGGLDSGVVRSEWLTTSTARIVLTNSVTGARVEPGGVIEFIAIGPR